MYTNPLDTFSLGLALMFGTAGLPHILMRFYTVPDAKEARKSVFYATGFIGYFYILTVTIGFGAAVLVGQKVITGIDKGGNMAAPLLAEALGGADLPRLPLGRGLRDDPRGRRRPDPRRRLALSHDLYVGVIRRGVSAEREEVKVAKAATVTLGILAVVLGLAFKGQNVAFMVGPGLRGRRERQLPGAADVDPLEALHDGGGGGEHLHRPRRSPVVMIVALADGLGRHLPHGRAGS